MICVIVIATELDLFDYCVGSKGRFFFKNSREPLYYAVKGSKRSVDRTLKLCNRQEETFSLLFLIKIKREREKRRKLNRIFSKRYLLYQALKLEKKLAKKNFVFSQHDFKFFYFHFFISCSLYSNKRSLSILYSRL